MLSLERQNQLRERYRLEHPGWQPATEVYADLVRHHLHPASRVLDLGCGRGGLVEQLQHPLARIVGLDPDWQSLREHRLPLSRAVASGHALPLPDAAFDIIMASWVLEHLQRPLPDLREVRRALKPNGVFIFLTPNAGHPLIRANGLIARAGSLQRALVSRLYHRDGADTFPAYYRANSPRRLKQLARQSGLSLRRLHTIPDPTYLAFSPALYRVARRLDRYLPAARQLHLVGLMAAIPEQPG